MRPLVDAAADVIRSLSPLSSAYLNPPPSLLHPAAQMSTYGFDCTQLSYLTGFAPMVECIYRDSGRTDDRGEGAVHERPEMRSNETVVLGAHFDSRGVRPMPVSPADSIAATLPWRND